MKFNLKKIFPYTLILIMTFFFAYCGDDDDGGGSDSSDNNGDGGNGDNQEQTLEYEEQDAIEGTKAVIKLSSKFLEKPFPFDAALEENGTVNVSGFPDSRSSTHFLLLSGCRRSN